MNALSTAVSRQEKLRESDPSKVVRTWTSSPVIYGGDSRQRTPNPAYHPMICQNEQGKFVDEDGHSLPLARVPAYIREEAKLPFAATAAPTRREVTLSDAMEEANELAATADRPPARRRGRPRKSA